MNADQPFGLPPDTVRLLQAVFAAYPEIDAVRLYGSRALGTWQPGSDIDLCIDAPGFTLTHLLQLDARIDDLSLPWKADITHLQSIDNPELRDHIHRVGRIVYRKPTAPTA